MAVKKAPALTDALQAIIDKAPGLRAAGVTGVTVGEVVATFAPADPPPPRAGRGDKEPEIEPDIDDLSAFRGDRRPSLEMS